VDGRDTLDKVASFNPHVILLDVMMPKLSGFEVCERLKGDPGTSPIMILMVTALGELGDIERAVEAGTDDFLSKPVNKVELVKRVENMLKLRHVSDELERLRNYISTMDDDLPPRWPREIATVRGCPWAPSPDVRLQGHPVQGYRRLSSPAWRHARGRRRFVEHVEVDTGHSGIDQFPCT
jgi:two-component system, OmpR family, alkaline phosphatase synthesis response regulator PhoP